MSIFDNEHWNYKGSGFIQYNLPFTNEQNAYMNSNTISGGTRSYPGIPFRTITEPPSQTVNNYTVLNLENISVINHLVIYAKEDAPLTLESLEKDNNGRWNICVRNFKVGKSQQLEFSNVMIVGVAGTSNGEDYGDNAKIEMTITSMKNALEGFQLNIWKEMPFYWE